MSDFLCLVLSLIGIVFLLYYILFKLFVWGEKGGVFVIPLYVSEREPRTRIRNIKKLFELVGFDKLSTLVVVDFGVAKCDLDAIKKMYINDEKLFVCGEDELGSVLEALCKRYE
ncbi:MAG: hypothetical protein BWY46_00841 [Firmicutes bacterium ADurb.Bin300]|nr:MAG: hypothetical protein BWY46_00841 [Firmicutes bacterium ADurb.Bin300]